MASSLSSLVVSFPWGWVRRRGRCLTGIFCPVYSEFRWGPGAKWWLLRWKAAYAVDDELIIYQMSALMKTGQLQATTAFAAAEVSTSLVTPGSSLLFTAAKRASSCAQTRHDYTLIKITAASFHVCQYCCWMEGSTNWKHSWNTLGHMRGRQSCVKKRRRWACDVADVWTLFHFHLGRVLRIDSRAWRWKGQWACFWASVRFPSSRHTLYMVHSKLHKQHSQSPRTAPILPLSQ